MTSVKRVARYSAKDNSHERLRRADVMTDKLATLIKMARSVRMSQTDAEEQRRSFAYGNTKIENDRITREMVAERAEALKKTGE